jgi:8-oxo-dGTP pyrophosphatase MutT (NUDIX family)
MTAIRETFEETGLLMASSGSSSRLDEAVLKEARHAIHGQKMLFRTFLAQHNLTADLSALMPFTQWVTPATAPRYDALAS